MSMSQRAASDSFTPFEPVTPGGASASSVAATSASASATPGPAGRTPPPPPLKVVSRQEPKLEFTPLQTRAATHAHGPGSGQPTVTLQRDGDRVTAIRIECQC